jgi:hypothetical protein
LPLILFPQTTQEPPPNKAFLPLHPTGTRNKTPTPAPSTP